MKINDLVFEGTCTACPEQYDVYDDAGDMVAYVRLRHGQLTCECPDVGGELVCQFSIGDRWTGGFESEEQRNLHLTEIACAINKWRNS